MAKKLQFATPILTETDESLTVSGKAADAKVTGEKIDKLNSDISQLSEENTELKVDFNNIKERLYTLENGGGSTAQINALAQLVGGDA